MKSFGDLRAAIAEVAAETSPVVAPPMTIQQVRDAAEVFAARHRREAARVVRLTPRSRADLKSESGGAPTLDR